MLYIPMFSTYTKKIMRIYHIYIYIYIYMKAGDADRMLRAVVEVVALLSAPRGVA